MQLVSLVSSATTTAEVVIVMCQDFTGGGQFVLLLLGTILSSISVCVSGLITFPVLYVCRGPFKHSPRRCQQHCHLLPLVTRILRSHQTLNPLCLAHNTHRNSIKTSTSFITACINICMYVWCTIPPSECITCQRATSSPSAGHQPVIFPITVFYNNTNTYMINTCTWKRLISKVQYV